MKKLVIFLFCCIAAIVISCKSKEVKVCSGQISRMSDTTIVAKIGDYDITFNTKKAEYTHGAVMPGDSVMIHYVGDLKEKKAIAAIVYLIPPKGNVVEAGYNPSKKLETAPLDEEDVKSMDEFVKKVKEDRKKGTNIH